MPWRRLRSSVTGLVVAALAVVTAGLVAAPGAHAHDYLVGSTPEQGATLTTPPSEVVLEFNTSIGQQFAQVAVVGQDGSTYQSGDPVVAGATVTQALDALPDAGDVTISYRVVSSDGHPIGGTVPFTIAAGGDPAVDEQTTPTDDTAPTGDNTTSDETAPTGDDTTSDDTTTTGATSSEQAGVSPLVWVAAGALALALAVGAMTLSRRRPRTSADA
jgi:methionine-rich copper-binding protein CopC